MAGIVLVSGAWLSSLAAVVWEHMGGVPIRARLACSLWATAAAWLIAGVVFTVVTKGPGTVAAWVIWAPPFFLAGWLPVGLPFVAFGDRMLRMPTPFIMAVAGLGGALVMELPWMVVAEITPGTHWAWSLQALRWPGIAFVIAASSAWFYTFLLRARAQP